MSTEIRLSDISGEMVSDLRKRYGEPQRAYHTWTHIEKLLALFDEVKSRLHDPPAVLYAILFHDAIYDPTRNDNEERSADLLCSLGPDILDAETKAKAASLVLATKHHAVPSTLPVEDAEDTAVFLDMDLSILAAPSDEFDAYEHGIRIEYAHVPEQFFKFGRARILQDFIARDRLFLSAWGHHRFEMKAKDNLRRSLRALEEMS